MSKNRIRTKTKVSPTIETSDLSFLDKFRVPILIIIAIFPSLLYFQSINHDYTLDDYTVIIDNSVTTQGIKGIPTILKTDYWYGYKQQNLRGPIYRPTSLIVFATVWHFFPNNPHVYHFINILFYSITCLVLFLTMSKLFWKKGILFPFICTILYAAHPIHTEVVNNIKSLDEILCFLFGIISLLFITKYLSNSSRIALIIGLISFYLSLISKETGITFLVVIPLTIYFFDFASTKKSTYIFITLLSLTGVYLISRMIIFRDLPDNPGKDASILNNVLNGAPDFISRKATAFYILLKYVKLLIFPHPLTCDYNFAKIKIQTISSAPVIISIILHFVLGIYALIKFPKRNIVAFGIMFYVITISPVSNIFFIGGASMAERFMYIPSLGFCIILTHLIIKVFKVESKTTGVSNFKQLLLSNTSLFIFLSIIIGLYSIKTFSRNIYWKDNITIYSNDIKISKESATANKILGVELFKCVENSPFRKNRLDTFNLAKRYLTKALKINPNYFEPLTALAKIYKDEGNLNLSLEMFNRAVTIKSENVEVYNNRGILFFDLNEFDKAMDDYNRVISLDPDFFEAYNNRGNIFFVKNEYDKALDNFNRALELDPDYSSAYVNRANILSIREQYTQALDDYNKALELDPKLLNAYINRGILFMKEKKYEEAIDDFSKSLTFNSNLASAYYYKGWAEFFLDRKEEACLDMNRAASLEYKPAIDALARVCK